jgi:hypothetical protein
MERAKEKAVDLGSLCKGSWLLDMANYNVYRELHGVHEHMVHE